MMLRVATAVLAAGCLTAVLTGCGSSSGSPFGSGSGSGAGSGGSGADVCGSSEAGLCTTVEITGAVTVQGRYHASMGSASLIGSCADYVKGESGRLAMPVTLSSAIGGHDVTIPNRVSKYKGPGTYERSAIGAIDGGVHIDVDHKSYQAAEDSTFTATIAQDGSGSMTFANLKEATNSSDHSEKGRISGRYEWTCHSG